MNFASQRVLLTGGAGFIGSHVAEALLRQNAHLVIIDDLNDFYPVEWKKANLADIRRSGVFEFHELDICDVDSVCRVTANARPDVIIHLAARAGVRPSIEQPHVYERVNVAGTLNLLDLARRYHVKKFIFGSSSSVYGATSRAPFSEDQVELRPISPYAATKLAGEMLCYTYAHLYGMPTIALRFFTVYGPRQRPDLAIHKFTALIESRQPVPIFGDGSTGRDYTYIDDIVFGVMASLSYEIHAATGAAFEVFNLGNSHPVTLSQLVELLEHATGHEAVRQQKPAQAGDVPLTWADIGKSTRLLGYRPGTRLKEGLERFVSWYRSADSSRRA